MAPTIGRQPDRRWPVWVTIVAFVVLFASMLAIAHGQSCWGPSCPLPRRRPSPTQPAQQPHPATVRVVNATGGASYYGTGTCIEHNGQPVILTCGHLFREGTGRIELRLPSGRRASTRLLGVDQTWDLAILSTDGKGLRVAVLAAEYPRKGERVTFGGYGSDRLYRARAGIVLGYVRADGTPARETLAVTGAARDGDSGGPMFNRRGQLVGVLWGTDARETCGTYCGRVRKFLGRILGVAAEPVAPLVPVPALPPEAPPWKPPVVELPIEPAKPPVVEPPVVTPTGPVIDIAIPDLPIGLPATVPTAWYVGILAALGWTGPPAVAAVMVARIGVALIRRRRAKKEQPVQEEPAVDFPQNPERDDTEAKELLRLGRMEGRDPIHDALIGQMVFGELDTEVETKGRNADYAGRLSRRLKERFNAIVPLALKPVMATTSPKPR